MTATRRRSPRIDITDRAWHDLLQVVDSAKSVETGGILLGFRERGDVQVVGVAEVPDQDATPTSYMFRREAAQSRLDEVRRHFPAGSPVGFIGDWHLHLANSPPSLTDRRSVARLGRQYGRTMASIVVARHENEWIPYGLVTTRLRSRSCAVRIVREVPGR